MAALRGADVMRTGGNTVVTVRRDANGGPGHVAVAAAPAVADPECDGDPDEPEEHPRHHGGTGEHSRHPGDDPDDHPEHRGAEHLGDGNNHPDPDELELDQELCSTCEEPKKEPPPCSTCEEPKEPELTCNEVHAVREGETCDSMVQCAGLGQDDFLRFNPNLCCDKLFVGQWVCLDATCAA